MKYFVSGGLGLCGYDFAKVIDVDSAEIAEEEARRLCIENADMYGFQQDPDHFGGVYDYLGREWDEDLEEYEEEGELVYEAVRYVPELHDDEL
jgi:hypothetical protein